MPGSTSRRGRGARPSGARGTRRRTRTRRSRRPARDGVGDALAEHRDPLVEPLGDGGPLVRVHEPLVVPARSRGRPTRRGSGRPATHGVSRRNATRTAASSSGSAVGGPAAPERELAQLGPVVGEDGQVDPPAHPEVAPAGSGGRRRRPPTPPVGRRTPGCTSARPGPGPPAPRAPGRRPRWCRGRRSRRAPAPAARRGSRGGGRRRVPASGCGARGRGRRASSRGCVAAVVGTSSRPAGAATG